MHHECRADIYCLEPELKLDIWRQVL